jgi:hypothetical protein
MNTPDIVALGERVQYFFNRIQACRRAITQHHLDSINSVTGCLKEGIPKWKFKMDEECLQADLMEAMREFNNTSVAHGSAVRAAMNGMSLKTHDEAQRLRKQAESTRVEKEAAR